MPKFVQEILGNLDFDFENEIPDFHSCSEEEFLFPDDLETL